MSQGLSSRQVDTWLFRAIYAYVAILAVVTFLNADSPTERWLGVGLILAFAVFLSRTPRLDAPEWQAHLYLGGAGGLAASPKVVNGGGFTGRGVGS